MQNTANKTENVSLVLNIEEDIKIPQDTVDDRKNIIDTGNSRKIRNYGRPKLDLTIEEIKLNQKIR